MIFSTQVPNVQFFVVSNCIFTMTTIVSKLVPCLNPYNHSFVNVRFYFWLETNLRFEESGHLRRHLRTLTLISPTVMCMFRSHVPQAYRTRLCSICFAFVFHSFFFCLEVGRVHCWVACIFDSIRRIVYQDGGQGKLNSRSAYMHISTTSWTPPRTLPRSSHSTAISCFCCHVSITRWDATIVVHRNYRHRCNFNPVLKYAIWINSLL